MKDEFEEKLFEKARQETLMLPQSYEEKVRSSLNQLSAEEKTFFFWQKRLAFAIVCVLCFCTTAGFTYAKRSGIKGDEVGFSSVCLGDGKYEIVVVNSSDKPLRLQDQVKVMQWSTGKLADGDGKQIHVEGDMIPPHSTGIVRIDLSQGYDVEAMEENLAEKDWYYFILTNNDFMFGQDWICSFGFDVQSTDVVRANLENYVASKEETQTEEVKKPLSDGERETLPQPRLAYDDWVSPIKENYSQTFSEGLVDGKQVYVATFAGSKGDEIYAVSDGIIEECDFAIPYGYYVILAAENGARVRYFHLQEFFVEEGDIVKKGEVIAAMGASGIVTGPALGLSVTVDGESIKPAITDEEYAKPRIFESEE